jgi:hypothetical protein
MVATAIFYGTVALLGGPTANDASESGYATWAIAHGRLNCSYPPTTSVAKYFYLYYQPGPHVPPLWPLISGAIAWLTRLGHQVPFPPQHAFGAKCSSADLAMYFWSRQARSLLPTLGLGYITWFALLAGVIAVFRASGRGRTAWEAAGVIFVAAVPIVWAPLLDEYHPQDLLALGLVLGGIACVLRRNWVWAGILVGLAVTSQQFALLALAPLVVVAPRHGRWKMVSSAVASWLVIILPMTVVTSGTAWSAAVIGSGNTRSAGGTVLWEWHLHGPALVFASRVLPIVLSMAMAWWICRRVGARVLEPVPLIALLTVSLSLRLVFEQNLFGYYFMAIAVMLIVLDVVRGQIRGQLVAWLALVPLAFEPTIPWGLAYNSRSWGHSADVVLPVACMAIVVVCVVWDAIHRRIRWYLVAWVAIALTAFGQWPPWKAHLRDWYPTWLWQLILVAAAIALASGPLVAMLRSEPQPETSTPMENVSV